MAAGPRWGAYSAPTDHELGEEFGPQGLGRNGKGKGWEGGKEMEEEESKRSALSPGRIYVGAGGGALAPQIQKLDDLSDMIFEVPKCFKMQIFPRPR